MSRNVRVISIAIIDIVLLLASSSALAQAGSVGGSVGPSEKTLSGDRNAAARAAPLVHPGGRRAEPGPDGRKASPKQPAPASRCQMLVGSRAFSNGVGVYFKPGGALSSTTGDGGRWSCEDGMVQAHRSQWTDHYLVSSDGAHITGNSGFLNGALTATKN